MKRKSFALGFVFAMCCIVAMAAVTQIDLTKQVQGLLPVANGGTNLGTLTIHSVILGQGTGSVHFAAPSMSGYVLTDNGGSSDPTFQALPGSATFVYSETPTGTVNGSNVTFTLAHTPTSGTLRLYMNGARQNAGAGNDYTLSTATITYLAAPLTGAVLLADYNY